MPLSVEIPAPVRTQMRPALVSQSGRGSVTPATLGARVPGRPAVSPGAHDPSPSPGRAGPAPTGGVNTAARAVVSTAVTAADASGARTLPAGLRDRRAPVHPGAAPWAGGAGATSTG